MNILLFRKTTLSFLAIWIISIFVGCAPKTPYSETPLQSDKTWVYIYSPGTVLVEGMSYDITVDGMQSHLVLNDNGYLVYDVPTKEFSIFVRNSDLVLGQLDHKELLLSDLKKGAAYYVKVIVNQGSPVQLQLMNSDKARQEIKSTVIYVQDAGTIKVYESQGKEEVKRVSEPIVDPRSEPITEAVSASSADEIQKLYELKKSGAISDEEFQVLKQKVIAK